MLHKHLTYHNASIKFYTELA